MKKKPFLVSILLLAAVSIVLPTLLLLLWTVTGRWPWPELLPTTYTLRTIRELFFGSANLWQLLKSSVLLAGAVAILGTAIGILTARATEFYEFPGKVLVRIGGVLPLLVPGTVFAMGIQISFIRLGLSDTVFGVILIHLIAAIPYCISIMTDVTHAVGLRLEEQAAVLGAAPLRAFGIATLPALLPGVLSSVSMGFILSYSQYFTTLIVGGGRVRTLALVLVPYIQSGDRALYAVYSAVFMFSALTVFAVFELLLHRLQKGGSPHET